MFLQILNIKNWSLEFSLSDSKQKIFFKELESIKLKLPNIKRIRIDNISDSDTDLNSFLLNWTPDQLELFAMNINSINPSRVKADFYIEALCKTLKSVTKEVYIRWMNLTSSDFEQIIKASSNSERLVFRYNEIQCATVLNFVTTSKYNIKFLSFDYWGDPSLKKSEFNSDPSTFKHIIKSNFFERSQR